MQKTIKTIILFFTFLIGISIYAVSTQNPPAHAKAHDVKRNTDTAESNVCFDL
ncbi:hypothetical protein CLU83_2971 [Flavobacterium sp. 1]|uniref:hypothetical protein n=1 Tax=Flavobacterium sp. 1 TaxID=2035200 RepID=UPI000CB89B31|nr:hypothetical protein [Flavobacterium sp. 1]PJJ09606.1 hypothetical protein CLU83_2971 [Flavobacterium sp. 1]